MRKASEVINAAVKKESVAKKKATRN